jgi:hypothetical protein
VFSSGPNKNHWPARYIRNPNCLHALSPSLPLTSILLRTLSCNKFRLTLGKESFAPSSLPGRLLTIGSLVCLPLFRILGVRSALCVHMAIIPSDHLLDPDLPLRNPEAINYPSKHNPSSSQCIRTISRAKSDLRARIASLTLLSPHPGFCTSSVPLTRHRRPRHSALFSYHFAPSVRPPALAPNLTNSIMKFSFALSRRHDGEE